MLFDPVVDLAEALDAAGHTITVETAGTVHRRLPCDLMSISPKLSNSTPPGEWGVRHDRIRLDRGPLRKLVAEYSYQLKFVVSPGSGGDLYSRDLEEISELLVELGDVQRSRVMLMAEGTDSATLRERERELVPICIAHGYRLAERLHIHLFGNRRGT